MENTQDCSNDFRQKYKAHPLIRNNIELRISSIHGYGVFAKKKILPGEIIEECPLVLLHKDQPLFILNNLAFKWDDTFHILALGYGCFYNHATENNAKYYRDDDNQLLIFKATKVIYPGEEICANYGDEWFQIRGITIKEPSLTINRRHRIIRLIILGTIFAACFLWFSSGWFK